MGIAQLLFYDLPFQMLPSDKPPSDFHQSDQKRKQIPKIQ